MKWRNILPVALALLLLARPVPSLAADLPSARTIDATGALEPEAALEMDGEAVLLYERNTDTLVYGRNIDVPMEPASLTKLMTCLLALEYGWYGDEITVTASALSGMDPYGSSAGLRPGEVYTLRELLYCLMVQSANDAALVIADYLGGSQEAFVEMMNQRALELGCRNTHFSNPHGLHSDDHYTTARDLAKIMLEDLKYDLFYDLYSTTVYVLEETETRQERTLRTTNYLISTETTDRYYDSRVLGGKTGYTSYAGRCVCCTAAGETLSYLAVVLGASDTDAEGRDYYGSFVTASALLDHGFWDFEIAGALVEGYTLTYPVVCGDADAELTVYEGLEALLPAEPADRRITTECRFFDGTLTAPVELGDQVGELEVCLDGVSLGSVSLFAASDVAYVEPPPQPKIARGNNTPRTPGGTVLTRRMFLEAA